MSSHIIRKLKYYQPFLPIGGAFIMLGGGLLYILDIDSTVGEYVGFQIIVGIGVGVSIQVPVIATQAFSELMNIPTVTATVLCKSRKPLIQLGLGC